MDIIGGISAVTEGIKLVNDLRKIEREVDKADLKLRLVELADKLLDAKQALQEAQSALQAREAEIGQLKDQIVFRGNIEDANGLLFTLDEEGKRQGQPYCNQCYVKEGKLFRLIHGPFAIGSYNCSNCGGFFGKSTERHSSELTTGYDPLDPYGD